MKDADVKDYDGNELNRAWRNAWPTGDAALDPTNPDNEWSPVVLAPVANRLNELEPAGTPASGQPGEGPSDQRPWALEADSPGGNFGIFRDVRDARGELATLVRATVGLGDFEGAQVVHWVVWQDVEDGPYHVDKFALTTPTEEVVQRIRALYEQTVKHVARWDAGDHRMDGGAMYPPWSD